MRTGTLPSFDGCVLHYAEAGEGTPIVFVHESAADSRQWRGQIDALSNRFRCISYNARGYLPSAVPPHDADYGYEPAWRDLAAVVEAVAGGPAHIVGLSMGAYAGLMLALERPDLVRSLFFAGGGAGSTREPNLTLPPRMEALAELFLTNGIAAGAESIAAPPNRTGFLRRDPVGWQAWYDDLLDHSPEGMAFTYRNYQARRPSLFAFEDRLRALSLAVMLAVGDEDPGCHEVGLFLKQTIPGAGLWMVPHCGHAINLEAPEAFNRELEAFIRKIDG